MTELQPSIGLVLLLYAAVVIAAVLSLLFLGIGYALLVAGSPLLLAAFVASSRSRWIATREWLAPAHDASSEWSPWTEAIMIGLIVLWLMMAAIGFAGGNPAVF